jgi:hypothetical protein
VIVKEGLRHIVFRTTCSWLASSLQKVLISTLYKSMDIKNNALMLILKVVKTILYNPDTRKLICLQLNAAMENFSN